jgi:hypothetical protein
MAVLDVGVAVVMVMLVAAVTAAGE